MIKSRTFLLIFSAGRQLRRRQETEGQDLFRQNLPLSRNHLFFGLSTQYLSSPLNGEKKYSTASVLLCAEAEGSLWLTSAAQQTQLRRSPKYMYRNNKWNGL